MQAPHFTLVAVFKFILGLAAILGAIRLGLNFPKDGDMPVAAFIATLLVLGAALYGSGATGPPPD